MYCYKRTTSGGLVYYEVFKAPKAKDENGDTYERYPKCSEFGFGTALCIRGDEKRTGSMPGGSAVRKGQNSTPRRCADRCPPPIMGEPKEKRRGGARDDSRLTIGLNRRELVGLLEHIRRRCEEFERKNRSAGKPPGP